MDQKIKWTTFCSLLRKQVGEGGVSHISSDIYQKLLSLDAIFNWNESSSLTCQDLYMGCLTGIQVRFLKMGEIQFQEVCSKAKVSSKFFCFLWWGKQYNMKNKMWAAMNSGKKKKKKLVIDCNGDTEKEAWALQNGLNKEKNRSFFQKEKLELVKNTLSWINTVNDNIWKIFFSCFLNYYYHFLNSVSF